MVDYLEFEVDVSEMSGYIVIGHDETAAELPAPYDVIAGIYRNAYLHSIAFGRDTHKGGAFP